MALTLTDTDVCDTDPETGERKIRCTLIDYVRTSLGTPAVTLRNAPSAA